MGAVWAGSLRVGLQIFQLLCSAPTMEDGCWTCIYIPIHIHFSNEYFIKHEVICNSSFQEGQEDLSGRISLLFDHHKSNGSLAETPEPHAQTRVGVQNRGSFESRALGREIKALQEGKPCSETSCGQKRWETIYSMYLFSHKGKHELEYMIFITPFPWGVQETTQSYVTDSNLFMLFCFVPNP